MAELQRILVGDWSVIPARNVLVHGDESIAISPQNMDVLLHLASRAGEVVSTEELIKAVWQGRIVSDGTVYQSIMKLRQALGDSAEAARFIETIPKRGYRLVASVTPLEPCIEHDETLERKLTIESSARPTSWRVLPTTALVAVAVVTTALAVWVGTRPEPRPVNRFEHRLPAGQMFRFPDYNVLAFSHDGRSIAYNATDGLYLRWMDAREARLIPGTEEPLAAPEFSPDGRSIIYVTPGDELNRISILGGAPVALTRFAPTRSNVSHDTAEWILYEQPDGIYRVSAHGGPSELIVATTQGERFHDPRLLPDRDSVMFSATRTGSAEDAQVHVQSISTGARTLLISGGADARYVPSGHVIYAFQDGLFAVAFDLETLTVSGVPVQVAQGVMRSSAPSGSANYGVSADGTLVYMAGGSTADARRLLWVDREGNEEPIDAPPRPYTSPRLSPDGKKVALSTRDQESDIWSWDLVGHTFTRLTFDPGRDLFPLWFPDGSRLAYTAHGSTEAFLVWQAADGTGTAEQLAKSTGQIWSASFLHDAAGILVSGDLTGSGSGDDIAIVPLDGSGEITALLDSPHDEKMPEISPDGEWLAYVSNESGTDEVYVRPFSDVQAGGRWHISTGGGGGTEPLWSRKGEELFFRRDGAVFAVPIQTDPVFAAGTPEVTVEGPYLQEILGGRSYDITPEGDKFLMLATVTDELAAPRIVIVQNWVEELKRLVPTE